MFSCFDTYGSSTTSTDTYLPEEDPITKYDLNVLWGGFVKVRTGRSLYKTRYLILLHTRVMVIMSRSPPQVRRKNKRNISTRDCLLPYIHIPMKMFQLDRLTELHALTSDLIQLHSDTQDLFISSPHTNELILAFSQVHINFIHSTSL